MSAHTTRGNWADGSGAVGTFFEVIDGDIRVGELGENTDIGRVFELGSYRFSRVEEGCKGLGLTDSHVGRSVVLKCS